jgi:membrane protease YdiL (CAAX protease family)
VTIVTWDLSIQSIVSVLANLLTLLTLFLPIYQLFTWFSQERSHKIHWRVPLLLALLTAAGLLFQSPVPAALLPALLYALIVFAIALTSYEGRPISPPLVIKRHLMIAYAFFLLQALIGSLFSWTAVRLGAEITDLEASTRLAATPWPWLLPLGAGLAASLYEELLYRKFLPCFLSRWLRSDVALALVTSLLWALTHLAPGVTPWYLRLIELGLLIGPLTYYASRRFGLFVVITAHYLYNAFVAATYLISHHIPQGTLSLLWLLLPCALLLFKQRVETLDPHP